MGQPIQVSTIVLDDVMLLSGDRSITGQEGTGYDDAAAAGADDRFPGHLAARIFATDPDIRRVFVASSEIAVRRAGGWDDAAAARVSDVVSGFFVHYGETPPAAPR
jgi:hypothetical protein